MNQAGIVQKQRNSCCGHSLKVQSNIEKAKKKKKRTKKLKCLKLFMQNNSYVVCCMPGFGTPLCNTHRLSSRLNFGVAPPGSLVAMRYQIPNLGLLHI